MRKLLEIARNALIGIVVLAFLGFGVSTSTSMPKNARLFVNPENDTYLGPPCLEVTAEQEQEISRRLPHARSFHDSLAAFVQVTGLYPSVVMEVRELDLAPDPDCRESGAFFQEGRSLTGFFLEEIGILKPLPSRWNPDGSWNW